MDAKPHDWVVALRHGHDRLAAFVGSASADDLVVPSMCTAWNVAEVLSHLGSGAEIGLARVTSTPLDNAEVWGRWNDLPPASAASSFVTADEQLVAWYEALSADELTTLQIQLPFLPAPIDAVGAVGFRLSEIALHSWDVFAAFDPAATLAPDAAALLIDRLPMMAGFVGRFTPRETRPPVETTIRVTTSDPERRYELELGDNIDLRPAATGATAGELTLPAEALLRLAAGRLASDREAGATITGVLSMNQLRAAFPGF